MEHINVLIVEDESIVAMDLRHRLENFGYTVAGHAISGKRALELADEKKPEIILMDIHLKGDLDGIQTAEIIKERHDIPILYLTAYSDQQTLDRAKVTEAFGYILKPYHERELLSNIEMALYKHQMQKALRTKERWLNTTINSISDGVVAADKNGNIHLVNNPLMRITGLTESDLMGKNISTLFEKLSLYGNGNEGSSKDYYIERDGKKCPLEISETELHSGKNEHIGKVVVLHDITERYEFEQALLQARDNAERASAAKSDFLATISHELRTPLNSILGLAEISKEMAGKNGELKENLAIVENAGKTLLHLINSILHFSQVDNKSGGGFSAEFSMEQFINSIFHTFAEMATRKQLVFRCRICTGSPKRVCGIEEVVSEILKHIIDNAIKFTDRGEITVSSRTWDEKPENGRVWMHTIISDTGKGLPSEVKEKIFEPFSHGENIYTRTSQGVGLGLAIARQKVEIIGGKIWVETGNSPGTTFHVLLPYGLPETEDYESAYIIGNETQLEQLPKEAAAFGKIECMEDYLDNAGKRLNENNLNGLEDDTIQMRELLGENANENVKEVIYKILFACRRNDRNTVEEGIRHLVSKWDE